MISGNVASLKTSALTMVEIVSGQDVMIEMPAETRVIAKVTLLIDGLGSSPDESSTLEVQLFDSNGNLIATSEPVTVEGGSDAAIADFVFADPPEIIYSGGDPPTVDAKLILVGSTGSASWELSSIGLAVSEKLGRVIVHGVATTGLNLTSSLSASKFSNIVRTPADTGLVITSLLARVVARQAAQTGVSISDLLSVVHRSAPTSSGLSISDSLTAARIRARANSDLGLQGFGGPPLGYTGVGSAGTDQDDAGEISVSGPFTTGPTGGIVTAAHVYVQSLSGTGTRSQAFRFVIFADDGTGNSPTTTVLGISDEVVVNQATALPAWIPATAWTHSPGGVAPTLAAGTKYWVGILAGTSVGTGCFATFVYDVVAPKPFHYQFITYASTTTPTVGGSWIADVGNWSYSIYIDYAGEIGQGISDSIVSSTTGAGGGPQLTGPWWLSNSFVNTPIGASPTLDSGNAGMIAEISGNSTVTSTFMFVNGGPGVSGGGSTTVYHANGSTAAVTINCEIPNGFPGHVGASSVTIPLDASWVTSPDGDAHISIICDVALTVGSFSYNKGDVIEFQAMNLAGRTAHSGAVENVLTQNGQSLSGNNVSVLPELLGLVTPAEVAQLVAGTITYFHHALRMILPDASSAFRYPAVHSDGGTSAGPPSGALLQLDPTLNLAPFGLDLWQTAIAKTLQIYGAYIADSGGSAAMAVQSANQSGVSYSGASLSQLPGSLVSHMRVIAPSSVPGV